MKKWVYICTIFLVLLSYKTVSAADISSITYQKALENTLSTNWNLKSLMNSKYQAVKQYDNTIKASFELSVDSIKERLLKKNKSLDKYKEMEILKQIYLLPKQKEYEVLKAENNYKVAENRLKNELRAVFGSVSNYDCNYRTNKDRADLAERKYKSDMIKFELGQISQMDIDQSEYDYQKVRQEATRSGRNLENALRNLNKLIGAPLNKEYDAIIYGESGRYKTLKSIDEYVEDALNNRLDILDLEKQIDLKSNEMSIMEKNNVHIIYRVARHDYAILQAEVEKLKLNLQQLKVDIEKNIKESYIDIQKDISGIKDLESTIDLQREQLKKLQLQYNMGVINDFKLEDMELSIQELENNLQIAIYNCNTKLQRLDFAAGYGPAY